MTLVTPQVLKDIATFAASEESKGFRDVLAQYCAEALRRDLQEADFKEFETAVAAQTDLATLKEWQNKLENALGVPPDLMERGREIMTAQIRIAEKACVGFLGLACEGAADRYMEMCRELQTEISKQGSKPPYSLSFRASKTNRSRSHAKNMKLGRHAERQAARWPIGSRRYKKWMRVAAQCGVAVWGTWTTAIVKPLENVQIGFDILPSGEVKFQ